VELERNEAPRKVEIPDDLAESLKASPDARQIHETRLHAPKGVRIVDHGGEARRHKTRPCREDDLDAPGRREASLSSTAVEAWALNVLFLKSLSQRGCRIKEGVMVRQSEVRLSRKGVICRGMS
jgi:hypothetical protein